MIRKLSKKRRKMDALLLMKETLEKELNCINNRINELSILPIIFAKFSIDEWFCIFRKLTERRTLFFCSHVCSSWRKTIIKYEKSLFTKDVNIINVMKKLEIDENIQIPRYIYSYTNEDYLTFHLFRFASEKLHINLINKIINLESIYLYRKENNLFISSEYDIGFFNTESKMQIFTSLDVDKYILNFYTKGTFLLDLPITKIVCKQFLYYSVSPKRAFILEGESLKLLFDKMRN